MRGLLHPPKAKTLCRRARATGVFLPRGVAVLMSLLLWLCTIGIAHAQTAGPSTARQSPDAKPKQPNETPMVKLLPALPRSYVVGVRRDWSPLTFANGQNQPDGFSVELLQAVAKEVGFTPEFKFYEPSLTSTEALLAGEIDISAAKVAMAAESDEVAQTSPYYLATAAIFTRRSDWSIRTLEDLKTKRVSVLRYSSAHDWAVTHNVNVLVLDAPRAVLASVADGRADACHPLPLLCPLPGQATGNRECPTGGCGTRRRLRGFLHCHPL